MTEATSSYVLIKLMGVGRFGSVSLLPGDTVGSLLNRACNNFAAGWGGLDATQLTLHEVSLGGDQPGPEEPSEALIHSASANPHLGVGQSLEGLKVASGAWLVAKADRDESTVVPPPTALAHVKRGLCTYEQGPLMQHHVMEMLRAEACRPQVVVRLWERAVDCSVRLYDDDFEAFCASISSALRLKSPGVPKLYYFLGPVLLSQRIPIHDNESLYTFSQVPGRPEVWVFVSPDGEGLSPEREPAGIDAAQPTLEAAVPFPPATNSTRSRRSSAAQSAFRSAVLARDGCVCVLCGHGESGSGKSDLEAAHVVAVSTPLSVRAEVHLFDVNDTANGITLCTECHYWFDRHMWCVVDNVACVAGMLLARNHERWGSLNRRELQRPPPGFLDVWPPQRYWSHQERLCFAAREEQKRAVEGKPFACELCWMRFRTNKKLGQHTSLGCGGPAGGGGGNERQALSPLLQRAFPQAAQGVESTEGSVRELDFEESGGEEAGGRVLSLPP